MTSGHEFLYQFGPFTVCARERVLLRDGVPVSLAPKALDILLVLVRNGGHLVQKDQLMAEVWPSTYVEEANLTQNISILRKLLDEGGNGASCIETVPRRGYRFLAPVTRVPDHAHQKEPADAESAPAEKVYRLLAILPFDNASADHQMDYLSDGITESIISSLSHLPQLRVMSRNAVSRFKGHDIDAQRIGRELGVDAVLLGRVQLLDGRLLISTELVDVADGWQLWGENYDREAKAILEMQDEIARQISATLKLKLTGEDEQQLTRRYTESADAYQAYLQGRYHWSTFTREGLEQATIFFREAINLDPNYALAYSGIIDCYLRLATNYIPPAETQTRRRPISEAAKQPEQATSVEADGDELNEPVRTRYRWDWTGVERELKRASELKTTYPAAHQWHAAYLFSLELFRKSAPTDFQPFHSNHPRLIGIRATSSPTLNELAQVLCAIAREQLEVGNFEAGYAALRQWWTLGDSPRLEGLTSYTAADLLFTAGALAGSVTSSRQLRIGQKHAEALLNGAIGLFDHLGSKTRAAEAQIELACCYYRQGLFDLARTTLLSVLDKLTPDDCELKSLSLIRLAVVERHAGRLCDSLSYLKRASELAELMGPWITARYYQELGSTLKDLALSESNREYFEQALKHYREALNQFEAVGNHRYAAVVHNNHGFMLLSFGNLPRAEEHLRVARQLFDRFSDLVKRAQVDESLARLQLAAGEVKPAEETINQAIEILENGDEDALLAEALTTKGDILFRQSRNSEAKAALESAYRVAERCGDKEGAGRALLLVIEKMGGELGHAEQKNLGTRVKSLLANSQQTSTRERLKRCLEKLDSIDN